MARCCGGSCSCILVAGTHISITGTGTAQDPFIVGGDMDLEVSDNSTFNLSLAGTGTALSPWVLSVGFASTASIDDLPDVDLSAKANGRVIGYNSSTGHWEAQAPTTAASGSVSHDTSMTGDGSVGLPLSIVEDPTGYLQTDADGLGLSDEGKRQMVRHFGNAVARAADTVTPALNTITMRDDAPGMQEYWNGSAWVPVTNGISRDLGPELLALSGSYVDGSPFNIITRVVSATTDPSGVFDVLTTADLAGAAGVLSVQFQETGVNPFKAMVFNNIDHISATAYRIDDGTVYASVPVTGVVTAITY